MTESEAAHIEQAIRRAVFENYGHMLLNGGTELARAALKAQQEQIPGRNTTQGRG